MPSSHLILCCPLLLLPPIPPSIRVFSNLSLRLLLKVIHFNFTTVLVDILSFLVSLKWKWLPEEALQMATERREMKSKGERERHTQLNAVFQRIASRDKKPSLNEQCKKKKIQENNRMGQTKDLFKRIGHIKGTFNAKMGIIKDRKGKDLI